MQLRRKGDQPPYREIRVPENATYRYSQGEVQRSQGAAAVSLVSVGPRFTVVEKEARCPAALQGVSRFSHRCQMPLSLLQVWRAVDEPVRELQRYNLALAEELRSYFESVGTSEPMRRLIRSASQCLDWPRILQSAHTPQDLVSFLDAYRIIKPALQKALLAIFPLRIPLLAFGARYGRPVQAPLSSITFAP